jgi:hypothetical protein
MLLRRRKLFFAGASVLVALALLLSVSCWYFRIVAVQDAVGYCSMIKEPTPPVWKALAFYHFSRGDPLKKLTDAYPPVLVRDYPPFKVFVYSRPADINAIHVWAKDDVLIAAVADGRNWEHIFFSMTPDEDAAAGLAIGRHYREHFIKLEILRIVQARKEGRSVFIAEVVTENGDTGLPVAVKVLETISGTLRAGEVITIPAEKYLDMEPVQNRKVILVVSENGKYESVSSEALQRARTAAPQ